MSEDRLDRLEALAEKILEGLAETKQRTDSNAKSIQALANEWRIERTRLYEAMTRVAAAQATFWDIQADYYSRLERIDERQARMLEILDRLEQRLPEPS